MFVSVAEGGAIANTGVGSVRREGNAGANSNGGGHLSLSTFRVAPIGCRRRLRRSSHTRLSSPALAFHAYHTDPGAKQTERIAGFLRAGAENVRVRRSARISEASRLVPGRAVGRRSLVWGELSSTPPRLSFVSTRVYIRCMHGICLDFFFLPVRKLRAPFFSLREVISSIAACS